MSAPTLLDERSSGGFRASAGRLLTAAETADFAVARIRLAALDLTDRELGGVRRCRVLLRELDAAVLADAAESGLPEDRRRSLVRLARFAASGRLEVRAAGIASWSPDFSVFRAGSGAAALVGSHQFGGPYPAVGPQLTVFLEEPASVRELARRFDELWSAGHDVLPAIRETLERADELGHGVAGGRGVAHPGDAVR